MPFKARPLKKGFPKSSFFALKDIYLHCAVSADEVRKKVFYFKRRKKKIKFDNWFSLVEK